MFGDRYLRNVTTLQLQTDRCNGCGRCLEVCPHAVLSRVNASEKRVRIADKDACMECGACQINCPTEAIRVKTGVGCAAGVLAGYFRKDAPCAQPQTNE